MKPKRTRAKAIEAAAKAHTDLCMFGTVQTILVRICQREIQLCLERYDRAAAQAEF